MKKINILMLAALTVFSGATLSAQSYTNYPALSAKQKDFLENNHLKVSCLLATLNNSEKPETSIEQDVAPIRYFLDQLGAVEVSGSENPYKKGDDDDDDDMDIDGMVIGSIYARYIAPIIGESCETYVSLLKGGDEDPYKSALARLYKLAQKFEKLGQETNQVEL